MFGQQKSKYLDHLEMAWVIIANSAGGNWENESEEWQKAAKKWRDEYHKLIKAE